MSFAMHRRASVTSPCSWKRVSPWYTPVPRAVTDASCPVCPRHPPAALPARQRRKCSFASDPPSVPYRPIARPLSRGRGPALGGSGRGSPRAAVAGLGRYAGRARVHRAHVARRTDWPAIYAQRRGTRRGRDRGAALDNERPHQSCARRVWITSRRGCRIPPRAWSDVWY